MKRLRLLTIMIFAAAITANTSAMAKTVECYCTDKSGSRIELGETVCMQVDGRSFMAQCQMSLNNPMWREVSESCLSS